MYLYCCHRLILRVIAEYPSVFQFSIDLFVITNFPTKTGDAFIKPLSTDFLGCTVVSSSISVIFQRKEKAVHVCIRAMSTLLWPLLLINIVGFAVSEATTLIQHLCYQSYTVAFEETHDSF